MFSIHVAQRIRHTNLPCHPSPLRHPSEGWEPVFSCYSWISAFAGMTDSSRQTHYEVVPKGIFPPRIVWGIIFHLQNGGHEARRYARLEAINLEEYAVLSNDTQFMGQPPLSSSTPCFSTTSLSSEELIVS